MLQHPKLPVGGVGCNQTTPPVCAGRLCNKLVACEVVNGMDNSIVSPPLFSQNPGMPPVDIVRDPRIGRLWTKYKETDLPVPKFKVHTLTYSMVPVFFPCGKGVLSKVADTPPSLISGTSSPSMIVRGLISTRITYTSLMHVPFLDFKLCFLTQQSGSVCRSLLTRHCPPYLSCQS